MVYYRKIKYVNNVSRILIPTNAFIYLTNPTKWGKSKINERIYEFM